jgi:hypothetical protein
MKKLLPITLLLTAGIVDVASAAMPGFNATSITINPDD